MTSHLHPIPSQNQARLAQPTTPHPDPPQPTWTEEFDDAFEDLDILVIHLNKEIKNSHILAQNAYFHNSVRISI